MYLPILHLPIEDMIPGELAPTSLDLDWDFSIACIYTECQFTYLGGDFGLPRRRISAYPYHVMQRNMLCYSNDQRDLGLYSLLDSSRGLMCRDINTSRVWFEDFHSLLRNFGFKLIIALALFFDVNCNSLPHAPYERWEAQVARGAPLRNRDAHHRPH
jgi:hypothetical protein